MIHTAEMRWFVEGGLPPGVLRWFEGLGPVPERQPPRTDYYIQSADAGLNVKLREGRVEVKRRIGSGVVMPCCNGSTGMLEHWVKWGFVVGHGEDVAGSSSWVAVEKHRSMLRLEVDSQGEATFVLPSRDWMKIDCLCTVELSRIKKEKVEWWSLCFEAFGHEKSLEKALLAVLESVLGVPDAPRLGLEHTMGYAEWLTLA